MNIPQIYQTATKTLGAHAPAILTALGVGGVLSTAYLTAKATQRATIELLLLEDEAEHSGEPVQPREKLDAVWKLYIPAVLTGSATIACIIASNVASSRRQAALYSALTLSETAFREYRDKAIEMHGEKKHQAVVDEVAKDRIEASSEEGQQIIISGNRVLAYDVLSGRYFESDYETVRKAMNDINAQCINQNYASLNEFWSKIGLKPLEMGEELGWNSDNMLELDISSMMSEDNRPVMAISFRNHPKPKFYTVWG